MLIVLAFIVDKHLDPVDNLRIPLVHNIALLTDSALPAAHEQPNPGYPHGANKEAVGGRLAGQKA